MADLRCHFGRHRMVEFSEGTKRHCARCPREEWLMSKPYPRIGEPKYSWRDMTLVGRRGFES